MDITVTEQTTLPAAQFVTFTDRKEWLQGRTLGIGSSDAASILGLSRFQSALSLYYDKLGLKEPNPNTEERREWGLALEEPIANRYAAITKRFIARPPAHSV